MIFLTHPLHGSKHAMDEAEAVADVKNGWERVVMREILAKIDQAIMAEVPAKRRPGRPKKVA